MHPEQAISAGMRSADIRPEQLTPMAGKVLKLRRDHLDLDVWIVCGKNGGGSQQNPKKRPMSSFLEHLGVSLIPRDRSLKPDTPLIFEGLDIRGSVGVLQTMQKTFPSNGFRLGRHPYKRSLGPMPAGLLIKTLRSARSQWLTSRDSLKRQAKEFYGQNKQPS